MSPRDPSVTQSDAPQLLADLIRELQLVGRPIGLLDFSDSIQPVFIIGSRGLTVVSEQPVYTDGEQLNFKQVGVAINEVLLDTGPLAAGVFDIIASISQQNATNLVGNTLDLRHMNAANTVILSQWRTQVGAQAESNALTRAEIEFSFQVAQDERFQWFNNLLDNNVNVAGEIMFHRRPDVA